MVRSEAQKKADKKYQKKANVIKTIKLTKGIDDDIIKKRIIWIKPSMSGIRLKMMWSGRIR